MSKLQLYGYDLLGKIGEEGIRYAWVTDDDTPLIESAAFPQHTKGSIDDICGYTTSVSKGCILTKLGYACTFCTTGTQMTFNGLLSAFDIAKQNIFMVLADVHCSEHQEYHSSLREFAYMGQGEPGYSYTQVREAIGITNIAMDMLSQKVYRHIISTAGIPSMIDDFKEDIQNRYYTERVTLHFSLHATEHRATIMPIDRKHPFKAVMQTLKDIRMLIGEKPCVGIMLFDRFLSSRFNEPYSNDLDQIKKILADISPDHFRLSFCEFNAPSFIGSSEQYDPVEAQQVLKYALDAGFEAKLFSSYGYEESTACGMLNGTEPKNKIGEKWKALELKAEMIAEEAYYVLRRGTKGHD